MAHPQNFDSDGPLAPARPDQTVGDVVRARPGALDVLKRLGVNHCCGAQLTLTEAASAAGVPLTALLAALDDRGAKGEPAPTPTPCAAARRVVLDVRGLEPPQPLVRVLEALDRLPPGDVLEVRHNRRPTLLYPQLDDRGFTHETDEPEPGLVRIAIWKHMSQA